MEIYIYTYIYIYIYIRNYASAIASASFTPGSRRDAQDIPLGPRIRIKKVWSWVLKQMCLIGLDVFLRMCSLEEKLLTLP